MSYYGATAQERAMKAQEVILRAMARKMTWWQAAEILGISDRQMRRWKRRYDDYGYDGLYDRRRGKPSPRRVPVETVEKVLDLYRTNYFDLNVRHSREKLVEEHQVELSYPWVKLALRRTPQEFTARSAALRRLQLPRSRSGEKDPSKTNPWNSRYDWTNGSRSSGRRLPLPNPHKVALAF